MRDVLVVDDDPNVRGFLTEALAAEGIPSRTATNGQGALAQVQILSPAVILLDMEMPVMNGPTFCAALDRTLDRRETAVVVMTASPRADHYRDLCHADGLLCKPFDLDELYAVVSQLLPPP